MGKIHFYWSNILQNIFEGPNNLFRLLYVCLLQDVGPSLDVCPPQDVLLPQDVCTPQDVCLPQDVCPSLDVCLQYVCPS